MHINGINNQSFGDGQFYSGRIMRLRPATKKQKQAEEIIEKEVWWSELLELPELMKGKRIDLYARAEDDGTEELKMVKKLPRLRGARGSEYIPFDHEGKHLLRIKLDVEHLSKEQLRVKVEEFLKQCKRYFYNPQCEWNQMIENDYKVKHEHEFQPGLPFDDPRYDF